MSDTSRRFGPLPLDEMTPEQRAVADAIMAGPRSMGTTLRGPFEAMLRSPGFAEIAQRLGAYVRYHTSLPARLNELAIIVVARRWSAQYEWSAHEPAGLKQGLEQSVIDVVKHNRDVKGLSDKDATLITFGRTLYREHKVSSELWQKMIGHFGRQHTVQLMMIMGDYFRVGFMMNAIDQHLPPERKALLPPLTR